MERLRCSHYMNWLGDFWTLNLEMVTTTKGFQNSLTLLELLEKVEQKAHCHNHDQSISNDDLSKIKTTLSCMNTLLII